MGMLAAVLLTTLAVGNTNNPGQRTEMPEEIDRVSLVPTQEGGQECALATDRLWGRLLDNLANEKRQGNGFNPLVHLDYPASPIFRQEDTGLNFEHIFNGAAADHGLAMFTPRIDPVTLTVHSATQATLHWPAEQSRWAVASTMTYSLVAPDIVDLEFRTTPTEDRFPLGYVAYMWASYMSFARDRRIHFYGLENGEEKWTCFGIDFDDGTPEMGTVACAGVPNLPYEEGAQALNIVESPTKQFLKPFYYGLLDGDHDAATSDDTLAYIMMFDQAEPIRFAMWNFISDSEGKANTHHPAWDWQYVIQDPKPGQTYSYRARVIIRPFESPGQVEALYEEWVR